jgi:hypothetical protein
MNAQHLDHALAMQMRTPKLLPRHSPSPTHSYFSAEEAEVDAVAQMEEMELQELIRLADEPVVHEAMHVPSSPTRYGSDEEEYDDIFMEILSTQEERPQEEQAHQQHDDYRAQADDSMDIDMSNG